MYVLPLLAENLTVDWMAQVSSSQASALPGLGQPLPAYTAILVSSEVRPHVLISAVPVKVAVHENQTSVAIPVPPRPEQRASDCPCVPVVADVVS
jgi:hypothetical protein